MLKTKGNKEYARQVINGILLYPAMLIPQLDNHELLSVIDDALHLYQDKEISLDVLINFAGTVQIFMEGKETKLLELLEEIRILDY